jgi:hypothetical protein
MVVVMVMPVCKATHRVVNRAIHVLHHDGVIVGMVNAMSGLLQVTTCNVIDVYHLRLSGHAVMVL